MPSCYSEVIRANLKLVLPRIVFLEMTHRTRACMALVMTRKALAVSA